MSVTGIAYNLTSLAYLAFPLGLCGAASLCHSELRLSDFHAANTRMALT